MGTLTKLSGQLGRESRYYYHQRVSILHEKLSLNTHLLVETNKSETVVSFGEIL